MREITDQSSAPTANRRLMGRLLPGGGRAHEYHFESEWVVPGLPERIGGILEDPLSPLIWWPAAFLKGELLDIGNAEGIGRTVRFLVKGCFPHTIQFVLRVTEAIYPRTFAAEVAGEFNGYMKAMVESPLPTETRIRCEWVVLVKHPLVHAFSHLLRPVFAWNHRWVMVRGERGLSAFIEAQSVIPLKHLPGPTFPHNLRSLVERTRWKPWTQSWELAEQWGRR